MIDFLRKLSRIGATNGMSERQVEGIVSQKILFLTLCRACILNIVVVPSSHVS